MVVKKTENISTIKSDTNEYILSEEVEVDNGENCNLQQDMFLEIDEEFKPIKEVYPEVVVNGSNVLGADCVSPFYSYSSEKICARTISFNADMGKVERELQVGDVVSRIASIELTEIEIPPLMNGSPVMDSSVRQIYTEEDGTDHWTLRPAGEMITKEVVASSAYPGDEQTFGLIDASEGSKTKSFGVEYTIEGSSNAEGSGSNKISISEYQESDCREYCRNYANPTPEKYLSSSEILGKSQNYPGYYDNLSEEASEVINDCDSSTRFFPMEINGTKSVGCTPSLKEIILSFKKTITDSAEAIKCSLLGESDENCVSTASIVIIMESPWGSKKDCADGACVTEFNDLRNGNFTSPGGNSSGKIYILTDCYANISGVGNKKLSCAWDVDYITEELEFQSHDNIPQEVFPDKISYMNFHVREGENRTDPVYIM